MYQGRHCTYSDYQLFENLSLKLLDVINRDNFELNDIECYLNTFSDFDSSISSKIRINLEKISVDKSLVMSKVKSLLEELKTNILVDIREHN